MSGQIFISYRREDSRWSAGRLSDRLRARFHGKRVFMDIELAPGASFLEVIESTVARCEVLIAIIGKNWLDSKDSRGVRRLDNPDDFVRMEIATALKRGIRVIPVLVDGAVMPGANDLPDELKPFVRRQAIVLSDSRFEGDWSRLESAIKLLSEKAQDERAEKERLAAEQVEKERFSAEQRKKERFAAEQVEKERLAAEQLEKERLAAEQLEKERLAAEQREKERLADEQREKERFAAEQREKERLADEQLEAEQRCAQERLDFNRDRELRELVEAQAEQRISAAVKSEASVLDLSGLQCSELPDSISRLARLRELYLRDNRLITVPDFIRRLSGLQLLDLSGNQLSDLPNSVCQLGQLRDLNLSDNQLSSLPESIGLLSSLRNLRLDGNRVSALPESLGRLKDLQFLHVSNNDLNFLPESMRQLRNLEELYLHGNSRLDLPTEILGPDFNAVRDTRMQPARPDNILAYYFENQSATRPLNEVKLLIVGRGQSGKSSIRDRLMFGTFDPRKPETPGIQIDLWSLKCGEQTILVRVWDFAGQEITHATHQFFLTERSVYLLVLDGRSDTQDWDAEYWLRLVSAFGKDSPVIIALNKSVDKPFDLDRFALLEKYPSLRAFVVTDCAAPIGIDELRKEIVSTVEGLEGVHEQFPAVWTRLKDDLANMKENYLPFDAYRKWCADRGGKRSCSPNASRPQSPCAGHHSLLWRRFQTS